MKAEQMDMLLAAGEFSGPIICASCDFKEFPNGWEHTRDIHPWRIEALTAIAKFHKAPKH